MRKFHVYVTGGERVVIKAMSDFEALNRVKAGEGCYTGTSDAFGKVPVEDALYGDMFCNEDPDTWLVFEHDWDKDAETGAIMEDSYISYYRYYCERCGNRTLVKCYYPCYFEFCTNCAGNECPERDIPNKFMYG